MRKIKGVLLFCFALVLIVGCSKEEIQPDPLNSADDIALKGAKVKKGHGNKDHYVPFKGTFEVYVSQILNTPEDPPPPKKQEVRGEGKANHLGKTEVYIYQEWRPNPDPGFTGKGEGYFTFTAANGDILVATYTGTSLHNPTDVDIFFDCVIEDYISGDLVVESTGRFKDAEGSFTWEGVFYPLPINKGTATITGRIEY